MTYEQLLLCKLAEEATEIAKDALKAQQFGLNSYHPETNLTNIEYITNELNDLFAILEMLNEYGSFEYVPCQKAINDKKEKVLHYMKLSQQLGHANQ